MHLNFPECAYLQGAEQKLKVGLLEESLRGTLGIRGVGDDDIELVLVLLEESKAVTDVSLGLGMVEASGHVREVLLGDADNGLYNLH